MAFKKSRKKPPRMFVLTGKQVYFLLFPNNWMIPYNLGWPTHPDFITFVEENPHPYPMTYEYFAERYPLEERF